ncbi:MAG TPA: hypothetical protein VFD49_17710 [Candidatus Dormibacteraeota bacterium]|nr:hypothetical protein [Candidatus Dormibacteraeota bacterium]
MAWVREAAGLRLPELELNVMLGVFPDGPGSEAMRQATRRAAGWMGLDLDTALRSEEAMPLLLTGPREHLVEQVMVLRERYGITCCNASNFAAEAMAPVVERLSGT